MTPLSRRLRAVMSGAVLALSLVSIHAHAVEPRGLQALRTTVAAADQALDSVLGVVMLDTIPDQSRVQALESLGITVQPMRHLPMALARAPLTAFVEAVRTGVARDVYPNQPLNYHSVESNASIGADRVQMEGIDGAGVGIAIVDSGIDGSHADLINNVVRNVRVYGPEYLSVTGIESLIGPLPAQPSLVVPFDDLPYNNTDTVGHGTHVAGIAGADGAGDPNLIGVAPAADLIGYSTGEILFIFTAVASFDDILATHEEYNIKVVNNSWGSSFSTFDPESPINVASKALHDAGMVVVFSAGNSSTEMSTNPNSMAPWVINVASATTGKERSGFSSAGLMYDNSRGEPLSADGHVRYEGNGFGATWPDVTGPGSNIVAPGTPTGVTVTTGTMPDGSASLSGTSMSAPHVAGVAALMFQVRPELTPDEVRMVLELTSGPMADKSEVWQIGYGYIDAAAAVAYVQNPGYSVETLQREHAARTQQLLDQRPFAVVASDHWRITPLPVSVQGLDSYSLPFAVDEPLDAIRASVAFPGDLGLLGINLLFGWTANLIDPAGTVVASSELLGSSPVATLQADFETPATPGEWTLELVGDLQLTQPAFLYGGFVSASAVQLKSQTPQAAAAAPARDLGTATSGGGSVDPLLLMLLGLMLVALRQPQWFRLVVQRRG